MKKSLFLFASVVLFAAIFYKQEPGLNLGIFGLLTGVALLLVIPPSKRTVQCWLLSVAGIASSFSFAWYGDFISFAALFISLLLTGFRSFYPRLSILMFPFYTAFNYASFICRVLVPERWLGITFYGDGLLKKIISYVVIPAALVGAFIAVYAFSSETFAALFTIDVEFDFFQLIVLAGIGFFFTFNLFYPAVPKAFLVYNSYFKDDFREGFMHEKKEASLLDVSFQRRSGEITLVLLNILLAVFIIIYCREHFGAAKIPGTLSAEVHERVYVLILSIIMAIVVILIYFQGSLNFDRQSAFLKKLSYAWICLNMLLILTVFASNLEYVHAYGLTFKRIGVFIFLLLALSGLFITWYKLRYKKTNIFLVSRMTWVAYSVLVISCIINWSWIVTKYNTSNLNEPDWLYLNSLNYNKRLLLHIYHSNGMDTAQINKEIMEARSKSLLSKNLYYEFLNIE